MISALTVYLVLVPPRSSAWWGTWGTTGHSTIYFILVFLFTGSSLSPQPLSLVPPRAHISAYFSFPSPWFVGDFLWCHGFKYQLEADNSDVAVLDRTSTPPDLHPAAYLVVEMFDRNVKLDMSNSSPEISSNLSLLCPPNSKWLQHPPFNDSMGWDPLGIGRRHPGRLPFLQVTLEIISLSFLCPPHSVPLFGVVRT